MIGSTLGEWAQYAHPMIVPDWQVVGQFRRSAATAGFASEFADFCQAHGINVTRAYFEDGRLVSSLFRCPDGMALEQLTHILDAAYVAMGRQDAGIP